MTVLNVMLVAVVRPMTEWRRNCRKSIVLLLFLSTALMAILVALHDSGSDSDDWLVLHLPQTQLIYSYVMSVAHYMVFLLN